MTYIADYRNWLPSGIRNTRLLPNRLEGGFIEFNELPEKTRLKLSPESEEELWREIEDRGIGSYAKVHGFSSTDLYNWRSKDVFLPKRLVEETLDNPKIIAFKGRGRSLPVENPEFPLPVNDELLTRIRESVSVNREGVPVYRSREKSLIERFRGLLQEIGAVPVSVYSRNGHELRYPKHLHEIFEGMGFEGDFAAMVDESGSVEDGFLRVRERKMPVGEFEGTLHSRQKRFELAVARGDSEEVERMMRSEVRRVSRLLQD